MVHFALSTAVLALLVADTTLASSAAVSSSKNVWHSPSFEEAVVEASRRGTRRQAMSEACINCCDKGCKTITGAKKCDDIFGETGEAAGTHAVESCKADGLTCVDDDGCLCVWLYNDESNCPGYSDGVPDCTVLPDPPIHVSCVLACRGEPCMSRVARHANDSSLPPARLISRSSHCRGCLTMRPTESAVSLSRSIAKRLRERLRSELVSSSELL